MPWKKGSTRWSAVCPPSDTTAAVASMPPAEIVKVSASAAATYARPAPTLWNAIPVAMAGSVKAHAARIAMLWPTATILASTTDHASCGWAAITWYSLGSASTSNLSEEEVHQEERRAGGHGER